jgi:hypothetical protein
LISLDNGALSEFLESRKSLEQEVIYEYQYEGLTDDEIKALPSVPIDGKSLDNYIQSTKSQVNNPDKIAMADTMQRYLDEAEKLQKLVKALEARGIEGLPYIQQKSQFGRYYHKRINLQSTPKVVRQAALGGCYEYDMNSAVLNLKMLVVDQIIQNAGIDPKRCHRNSRELLLEKKSVIKRLAGLLSVDNPIRPSLIKKLITALAFGAPLSECGWKSPSGFQFSSFTEIIMRPDDRKALVDDGWLTRFAKEQKEQTQIIVDHFIEEVRTWVDEEKLKTPIGRWRKSAVMALIYQEMETKLMRTVIEAYQSKVILHVHDAIYTSKPLDREEMEWVVADTVSEYGIKTDKDYMNFKFSMTKHKPYAKNLYVPESESDRRIRERVNAFDRSPKRFQ